ncbi:MAG TPA: response regulator [Mucilaginibacter sp.]|jgi:DNA-binding NarL/FixJ family response regulator|nr:response regulator [Mucilaginibacter sp.]
MFENVLIAEDHESTSISVRKTLEDLGVTTPQYAYYCDDALTRIRNGIREGQPYELLITDLFFEEDDRPQQLTDGAALIAAARQAQPGLKVLVFSAEHRAAVIEGLYSDLGINGYVRKARRDAQELKSAIEAIHKNKIHYPVHLRQTGGQKNTYEFSEFDITIITLLSNGMHQKDIPAYLAKKEIRPSSLSSLEKRLNLIKETFEFSKNEQLVAFCKDMGII